MVRLSRCGDHWGSTYSTLGTSRGACRRWPGSDFHWRSTSRLPLACAAAKVSTGLHFTFFVGVNACGFTEYSLASREPIVDWCFRCDILSTVYRVIHDYKAS